MTTPSGSSAGVNGPTCSRNGLSWATPSDRRICVTSRADSSRFFSDSGSIDGAMTYFGMPRRRANFGREKTAASNWLT